MLPNTPLRTIEFPDAEVVRVLRRLSPGERLQIAYDSNRLVRERLRAHLAHEHPDWSEARLDAALAERMLYGTS
jgi:hypothetical protein